MIRKTGLCLIPLLILAAWTTLAGLAHHAPAFSAAEAFAAPGQPAAATDTRTGHDSPRDPAAAAAKVWRVAYIEGGPYTDYQQILAGTVRGLARLGIIPDGNVPVPQNSESTREMWQWLADHASGGRLQFIADGYYSADWNPDRRTANRDALLKRLREKGDVDMVFAFGTWAGLDTANDQHKVPTFSMSVTDAVGAGIVKSVQDSGFDHVHAQLEPGRYERQLAVFHDVFHFKRLGVPFDDSPEGRASIAMPVIEKSARELGFTIVPCPTRLDVPDLDLAFDNLRQCVETLSTTSDAIYLTTNTGMQGKRMVELLQPVIRAGIPTFSQSGPEETKLGVLLSLAQASFDDVGMFEAEAVSRVLSGAKPREVSQVFEGPLGLAINLRMAMLIGWNPPFEILAAVDEIHQQIRNAEQ